MTTDQFSQLYELVSTGIVLISLFLGFIAAS